MAIEQDNGITQSSNDIFGEDRVTDTLQNALDIELAQTTDDIQPVDAVPTNPENLVIEPNEFPSQVSPDGNNIVRLPSNTSLENVEISGSDLLLTQADGSVIIIKNAAINIPTFIIGDVEIPQIVLATALEASNINVAAGPDGSLVATSSEIESSGNNFSVPAPGIGDADPILDLLPYTELVFPQFEREELFEIVDEDDPVDDIPVVGVAAGTTAFALLDESDGTGTGNDGVSVYTIDAATVATLFITPDFGANGPGSITYALTGVDGAGTGLFLTDSTVEITLNVISPTQINAVSGTTIVFEVIIEPATGEITITQHATLDHSETDDHDDVVMPNNVISIVQTAIDADGDTASATSGNALSISFEDDGPKASATDSAEVTVALDESDGTGSGADGTGSSVTITGVATSLFATPAYGADGAGSTAYTLSATDDAQTGLFLTGSTTEILLVKVSDTEYQGLEGGTGGTLAFTVSIDGATGDVTVTQHATLDHPDTADHDDLVTLAATADISVVQTITDGDGDTATATSANALDITFGDDGPKATAEALATDGSDTAVVDESSPVHTGTDGSGIDGIKSATVSLGDNFTPTAGIAYGADGAGTVAYALVLSSSNVGSGLYALGANGAQGAEIVMNEAGGTITGAVGGTTYFTITVDGSGVATFTLEDDAPIWHLTTTDHDDTSSLVTSTANALVIMQTVTDGDGDTATASIDLATSGNPVFNVEDDGPKATAEALATDGSDTAVVDESSPVHTGTDGSGIDGIKSATVSLGDNFTPTAGIAYGADGAGTVAYALVLSNSNVGSGLYALGANGAQGAEIVMNEAGGTITGAVGGTTYFTITVDGSGVATFTLEDDAPIWHSTTTDHDDTSSLVTSTANALVITQTVTDGDGDTATASIDLATSGNPVFNVEDDGPKATAEALATDGSDTAVVDESSPVHTGTDGSGIDGIKSATVSLGDNFTPTAGIAYGADGAGTVAYALVLSNSNVGSGLYALGANGAQGAEIVMNEAGGTITGAVGGTTYFTITVDGSGVATFTLEDDAPIWHSTTTDHDDTSSLVTSTANALVITQTVTDGDGDTATASIDLATSGNPVFNVEDDGPKATAEALATDGSDTAVVDESSPVHTGTDGSGIDGIKSATVSLGDNFTPTAGIAYGADGAGTVAYALVLSNSNVGSGLYALGANGAQGAEIVMNEAGGTITGAVGGTTYFTITVDGSGVATFTLEDDAPIWHLTTTDHDDTSSLVTSTANALVITQTVTDGDGDTATASIDLATSGNPVFNVGDDGPKATAEALATDGSDTAVVDESSPVHTGTDGSGIDGIKSATVSLGDNFTPTAGIAYGADGAGTVAYALVLSSSNVGSGLYALGANGAQGAEIVMNEAGGTITGAVGGTTYFTITVDGSGVATFTLEDDAPIWHLTTTDHDDTSSLVTSTANALVITQTVTDGDGDTATASIDLATSGNPVFNVGDDGPKATAEALATDGSDTAVVDESSPVHTGTDGSGIDGIKSATVSLGDNFTPTAGIAYGADGAGTVAYALVLSNSNVGSGLYALGANGAQGAEIVMNEAGGTITGAVGGTTYFTITVDGSGVATFTLEDDAPIWHLTTTDHDDTSSLVTSTANALVITQTVTDGDGDTATASIDLATSGNPVFNVEDDGPKATAEALATDGSDTAVVDESSPVHTGTDGSGIDGIKSATVSLGDNFTPTAGIAYGADGAGTVAYALVLSNSNVGSGLYALGANGAQGAEIVMNEAGGTITGAVGGTTYFTITVDGSGVATFTLEDDAPIWHSTTTDHDDTSSLVTSTANALVITQTVTDGDGDTATASIDLATSGNPVFNVEDDGPKATAEALATDGSDTAVVDESSPVHTGTDGSGIDGIKSATVSLGDNFTPTAGIAYGADGAGTVAYALVLSSSNVGSGLYALGANGAQGAEIVMNEAGGTITGAVGGTTYFTITVDGSGVATFTLEDDAPIWHSTTTDHDDTSSLVTSTANALVITQTVTDGDGDTATASIDLATSGNPVFNVGDDGPKATAEALATDGSDTAVVDESSPVHTGTDGSGIDGLKSATVSLGDNFTPTTGIAYGADGAGTVAYALVLSSSNVGSGLYALGANGAQGAEIVMNEAGGTITGAVGGTTYFTITVDGSGVATFTLEDDAPIWHLTTTDHDDTSSLVTSTANALVITQTVTDGDGDTATASIDLATSGNPVFNVGDDGPKATAEALATDGSDTAVVDESSPVHTGTDGSGIDGIKSATVSLGDNFTPTAGIAYGADGAGTVAYALVLSSSNVGSGLYALGANGAQGAEIVMNEAGGTITGAVGGTTYFTITVDGSGVATFTLEDDAPIWHLTTTDHDDTSSLVTSTANALVITQTVTDGDGDTATASIDLATSGNPVFNVGDDGPKATAEALATDGSDTAVVDESSPVHTGTDGSGIDGIKSATVSLGDNFTPTAGIAYGADGAGTVAYALVLSNSNVGSGLYALGANGAQGAEIVMNEAGGTITGAVGGTTYFTITVDGSGVATFTLEDDAPIWHLTTTDHDDTSSLVTSTANALVITQTVTDGDGDTATASIDLATSGNPVFNVGDDGPKATAEALATDGSDTAVVDESSPVHTGTDGSGIDGIKSATVSLGDNFTPTAGIAYGADGAGTVAYALVLSSSNVGSGLYALGANGAQGAEIVMNEAGGTITGAVGGTTYFTITVDGSGVATFTLEDDAPIWHLTTTDHDDTSSLVTSTANALVITQTVTDGDGDTATASIDLATSGNPVFNVEDDGPKATAEALATDGSDTAVVDESSPVHTGTDGSGIDGIKSATVSLGDNFTPTAGIAYGADGAGTVAYALVLSSSNVGSGLYALGANGAQGAEIVMNEAGGTITGAVGGTTYFTITVDGSGVATFTLEDDAPIWHLTTTDHDDTSSLVTSTANALVITQTVTDGDGDTATASIDLATSGNPVFNVGDDGPKATAEALATDGSDTAVVDESSPVHTGTDGSGIDGIKSATVSLGDNFTPTAGIAYGADGAGTVAYALVLSSSNVGSGLYALGANGAQGAEIVMNEAGGTITGAVGGTTYFTITVDGSGVATFTLEDDAPIWHLTTTDHDDTSSLVTSTANALVITQTVTDGDGDTATASIDLATSGNPVFNVGDDGPKATAEALATDGSDTAVVDESSPVHTGTDGSGIDGIKSATVSLGDNFTPTAGIAYGADGAGTVAYALVLSSSNVGSGLYALGANGAQGAEIVMNEAGGTITGAVGGTTYFTITVDGSGVATFTLEDDAPIWHLTTTDHDDTSSLVTSTANALVITQTVTDGDGDTATASIDLATSGNPVFNVEDDGPKATATAGATASAQLDESDGTGSGADGTGSSVTITGVATSLFATPAYGADGAGSTAYTLSATDDAQTGLFLTGSTTEILLVKVSDTEYQGLEGGTGGTLAFTVSIDGATGDVTVTQAAPLDHPDTADHDDDVTLAAAADISVVQTITDGDGDTATDTSANALDITFGDDGPANNANEVNALVHEDALDNYSSGSLPIEGSDGNPEGGGQTRTATFTYAAIMGLVNFGADGAGAVELNTATLDGTIITGVTSQGETLEWNVNAGTIEGISTVDGRLIFTVTRDDNSTPLNSGDDTYTFTLIDQVDHLTALGDGDASVEIDIAPAFIAFDGDGDSVVLDSGLVVKIENDVPVAIEPDDASLVNESGSATFGLDIDDDLADNVGADELASVRFPGTLDGTGSGMTYGGQAIIYTLSADGQTLFGMAGATEVLRIELDAANVEYTVVMSQAVDSTTNVSFSSGGYQFVGGNSPWGGFLPTDPGETAALLMTPEINGIHDGTINSSTIAGGVGSGNSVGSGEVFRVDFVNNLAGNPSGSGGGDYDTLSKRDHTFDDHFTTNGASAVFTSSSGSTLNIAAYDDFDGDNEVGDGVLDTITGVVIDYNGISSALITADGTYIVNSISYVVSFQPDGSVNIAGVEGTSGSSAVGTTIATYTTDGYSSLEFGWVAGDTFKIGNFGASVPSTDPVNFEVPVEIVDYDGDSADGTISVELTAPPVILDLDGDGVESINLSDSTVAFDYDGDGTLETTAWVGADDGLLAIDLNGDGIVNDGSEIVFAQYAEGAETDLEGLAGAFDTNHDGKLTEADDQFEKFGVWVDADSDGVTDEGEFSTLIDFGITEIELVSDGIQSISEDGSVTSFGTSQYTMSDGSTGAVGDVAFAYSDDADNTFVMDEEAAAEIIEDFEADVNEIDLTSLLDNLVGVTNLEASEYVDNNNSNGEHRVDDNGTDASTGTVVATLDAGLNETINILFDDDNGTTSDVV